MPHHDPLEFPENPCSTGECSWDRIGGKRVMWCSECGGELLMALRMAQSRCCYDLNEGHPASKRHRGTVGV